jgi:predicted amidohydrolase
LEENRVKLGIAQIALNNDIDLNLAKIGNYTSKATKIKTDILCFPECSLTSYRRDFHEIDWNEILKALDALQEIAAEKHITLVVGTPYLELSKLYNAAVVISANSQLRYFKNNLTDFDKQYFAKGQDMLLFEVKGIKCGVIICRDQNYPLLAQKYACKGVRVLFLPSAHYYLPDEAQLKLDKNRALPIARAVENNIFVAKANAVGFQGAYTSLGHSMIVNPEGLIICEADEATESILYHEVG